MSKITTTLYEQFKVILNDRKKWNFTHDQDIDNSLEKIFLYPHSYNFIVELLWGDGNLRSMTNQIFRFGKNIPHNRYAHTISLFLLGCVLCDKIGTDKFNLPKWDDDSERNFLHHWAAICLSHDFGYCVENNKEEYPPYDYANISDIVSRFKLEYNLIEDYASSVIERYYIYRQAEHKCIDHGIAGALFLYNALMCKVKKMEEYHASGTYIISEKPLFGVDLEEDIAEYAKIIAYHNIWIADSDSVEAYKKYGLYDLIPQDDKHQRIAFQATPMLFILCLLDTIDLIKRKNEDDYMDALRQNKINIYQDGDNVRIELTGEIAMRYGSCKTWLDVTEEEIEQDRIIVSFHLR